MSRTTWVLCAVLLIGAWKHARAESSVKALMARVGQTEIRDSRAFADYVPAHHELADALIEAGKIEGAIRALRKAVEVDGWNFQRTFQLGMMEIESAPQRALDRIDFVAHRCPNSALANQAHFLLGKLEPARPTRFENAPSLPELALHMVGFAGSDPLVLAGIATAIGREFGIPIIPIQERPVPDSTHRTNLRDREVAQIVSDALRTLGPLQIEAGLSSLDLTIEDLGEAEKRESFAKWYLIQQSGGHGRWEGLPTPSRKQLDAGMLLGQLAEDFEEYLDERDSLGVMAITGDDLFAAKEPYVLEYGGPTVGVISYARLAPRELPRHRLIQRAARVGIALAGTIIPIGICSTVTCPRSPAKGPDELDGKADHICGECRAKLGELYARRRSLVVSQRGAVTEEP